MTLSSMAIGVGSRRLPRWYGSADWRGRLRHRAD
jgi:hypothetical protein